MKERPDERDPAGARDDDDRAWIERNADGQKTRKQKAQSVADAIYGPTPKKERKKKRVPPSRHAPSSPPKAKGPAGVSWKQWAIGSAWLLCAGIFWKVCLATAPATSPSATSIPTAPEPTATGDPAPVVPPSLAIIESDCRDAAIAKLPAGATMPHGLSIGSLTSGLPERGPTSARWRSVYTKANGAPSTWSCSYDYASKAATITLE